MLILENLTLQAAKRSFLNSTTKFIKISISTSLLTQTSISQAVNNQLKSGVPPSWNGTKLYRYLSF
jgi:hypothetical protein